MPEGKKNVGVPLVEKGGQNLLPGWNRVNLSAKNWGCKECHSWHPRFRHSWVKLHDKLFGSVENNLLSWIFLNPRFGIVRWKIIFISGLSHIQCVMEKFGQSRVPVTLEKRQTRWCNLIVIKKLPSFECSFGQIYFPWWLNVFWGVYFFSLKNLGRLKIMIKLKDCEGI